MLDRGAIDSMGESRAEFRPADLTPGSWRSLVVTGRGEVAVQGDRLWTTRQLGSAEPYLLGRDPNGTIYLAQLWDGAGLPAGVQFRPLIEMAATLGDNESFLAAQAVALGRWHDTDRYCVRCGHRVQSAEAGWASRCQHCGHVEYPRTDPVVIVRVTDGQDRVLLAHNAAWDRPMLSVPAGYIEAGETPRRAIERELWEEVSVPVQNFSYLGAQPWPGPRSLMLAFHAETIGDEVEPVPDRVEIDYARFFARDEYVAALQTGQILAPRPSSIAAAMLSDWLGAPLTYPQ